MVRCREIGAAHLGQTQARRHPCLSPIGVVLATSLVAVNLPATRTTAQTPFSGPLITISGRVVAASSGNALARARVQAIAESAIADTVLTTDDGFFTLSLLRASDITLAITKAGYAARELRVSRQEVLSRSVGVQALASGAALDGRILETTGEPASSQRVVVQRMDAADRDGAPGDWSAITDDRGEYRVGGLVPGRYMVTVRRSDATADLRVAVKQGEDVSGVRLVLPPVNANAGDRTQPPLLSQARGHGTVRGRVVSDAGEPLAGALVRLRRPGASVQSVSTDADGSFAIVNVPPGPARLQGSRNGYVSVEYGQRYATEIGRTIDVRADETVRGLEIALPRGSVINGLVVDEHGEPVEGAIVRALQLRYAGGRRVAVQAPGVRERRTDDLGRFRLFGLLPGRYLVAAFLDAAVSQGSAGEGRGYAPSFYPGNADVGGAWPLTISAGRDEFGIQVALASSPAVRVVGSAVDSSGRPLQGTVLLGTSQRSGSVALEPRTAPVAPDGSFVITNVAPGDYVIQAVGAVLDDAPGEFASQFLTIADAAPPPVLLTAAPGARFQGHVRVHGHASRPLPRYTLLPLPVDFDKAPLIGRGVSAGVNPFGVFTATGLTGPTRFVLDGAPPGWYLQSVRVGAQDATDVPFDFGGKPGWSVHGEIVIATDGGRISGTVSDEDGKPVEEYTVVVFPSNRSLWRVHSRYLTFARPSLSGTFDVEGLPPGEYLAAAVRTLDATAAGGEWQDPEVLENLAAQATSVTVSEGATAHLALSLGRD